MNKQKEGKNSLKINLKAGKITLKDLVITDVDSNQPNDQQDEHGYPLSEIEEGCEGYTEEHKSHSPKIDGTTSFRSKNFIISPSSSGRMIQNKRSTIGNSSEFVKIAPKSKQFNPSSTASHIRPSVTATKTSNGKIIYLQRSGNGAVPIRVPGTIASNNLSKAVIHVVCAADGNLIPFKGSGSVNIPSSISQITGKRIVTTNGSGVSSQMLFKHPVKTIPDSIKPVVSTTKTTASLGSTMISSVEIDKPKMRQIVAAKSVVSGSGSGGGKILMHSSTGTRQVVVSQNVIKLSPNTASGQLQAIQMPGKTGLQYVRVLNNKSGITQTTATTEVSTLPKYTVVRQTKSPTKFVVKSPVCDTEKQKITTFATFRKINELAAKPREESAKNLLRTQKISQMNSQIQRLNTAADGRIETGSKYIVVPKSIVRGSTASHNLKIMQSGSHSPTLQKKLYSVLKPNVEMTNVQMEPPLRKSGSSLNNSSNTAVSTRSSPPPSDDSNVTIRRKHCNCTKSQCLKLYCDCFANGEFCQDCNCKDCLNNLDNEDERQKAIRICLERNPNSFKPKITAAANESDQRLHNKGCNCKRSGCLKNYCECYEAKIPCSSNCKCIGCRNVEDHPDLDLDLKKCSVPIIQSYSRVKRTYDDVVKTRTLNQHVSVSTSVYVSGSAAGPVSSDNICDTVAKQPCNFITQEVVDATIQCLIAQADECKKEAFTLNQTEKMIMEELGRCLVEIIDFSIRNTDHK